MSTPNINCILQAVLAATNNQISPPPQIANFDFGNPTFGATVMVFEPYIQAPVGPGITFNLPAAAVHVVMVQNLAPSGILQVQFVPGGSPSTVTSYGPGGVFIHFDPNSGGSGITAVTLIGVGGTIPAMILVAN